MHLLHDISEIKKELQPLRREFWDLLRENEGSSALNAARQLESLRLEFSQLCDEELQIQGLYSVESQRALEQTIREQRSACDELQKTIESTTGDCLLTEADMHAPKMTAAARMKSDLVANRKSLEKQLTKLRQEERRLENIMAMLLFGDPPPSPEEELCDLYDKLADLRRFKSAARAELQFREQKQTDERPKPAQYSDATEVVSHDDLLACQSYDARYAAFLKDEISAFMTQLLDCS
jgi:hypothetical protein